MLTLSSNLHTLVNVNVCLSRWTVELPLHPLICTHRCMVVELTDSTKPPGSFTRNFPVSFKISHFSFLTANQGPCKELVAGLHGTESFKISPNPLRILEGLEWSGLMKVSVVTWRELKQFSHTVGHCSHFHSLNPLIERFGSSKIY